MSGPMVARALGPSGRGELAAVTVYAALTTTLASLGVPVALGHAVANDLYERGAILGTAVRFSAALVPVCLLAALVVVAGPLSGLSAQARGGAFVLIALVPVGVLGSCLLFQLLGRGALGSIAGIQVAPIVIQAVLTAALYVLGWLTLVTAIATAAAVVIASAVIGWRAIGVHPAGNVRFKPILSFAFRGFAGNVATFTTLSVDQAIIGPILGTRLLGFYAVAVSIANLPYTLGVAIGSRAFGEVAAADETGKSETAWRFIRLTFLTSLVGAVAVAVASPVALPWLYGGAFGPSVRPLLLLLPGTVALSLSAAASAALNATGRPGRATIAELIGFGTTIIGLPLIIPRFGLVGAAVLSTVAYSLSALVYLSFVRSLGPMAPVPRSSDFAFLNEALRRTAGRVFKRSPAGG